MFELIVKEGYPLEEILNTADAKGCDVIVLGTHGKGGPVPGHRELCKKDYLEQQAGIIRQRKEAARSAIKQGLSVEGAAAK